MLGPLGSGLALEEGCAHLRVLGDKVGMGSSYDTMKEATPAL